MLLLNKISKSFHDLCLFKDLSIQVEKGQSVVILGQSGVGKTTLLKMMAGLVAPDEGQVSVDTDKKGMLFQKDALFDSLTAVENLEFVLEESNPDETITGDARRRLCSKYLEWVELGGKEDLYPDELSGGMQKRLAIFFIPAGAGIIKYSSLLLQTGTGLLLTLVLSTLITLGLTALIFRTLLNWTTSSK